ncbi:MAG TPA: helix-turn-helix domain-containing protein [Pyrinomonadaceae bacterium]
MDMQTSLMRQLDNPNLTCDQRAELRCQSAKELEDAGDYEAARKIMGELWRRIGDSPQTYGLEQVTSAEVLLRAGVLTGVLGSKNQITGAQETAKNLISESLSIFESLRYAKKIAEAQIELALCYWRTGEYDEARDVLKDALSRLTTNSELKAIAVLRWAIVELEANRYHVSLRILQENADLFEMIKSHNRKGSYHHTLANVLENLWESEKQTEYLDRAFVEYAAASYHFEQAGHKPYLAHVENNLGFLYFKIHRFEEAHKHLECGRRRFINLKNSSFVAQVDETRARVFLAERRYAEAEKAAKSAVGLLESGGQQGLLSEALITYGRALARLGCEDQGYVVLRRAIRVAQESGAVNRAGEAALAIFEELGERTILQIREAPPRGEVVQRGEESFSGSGLIEVRRYEHDLIKQALVRAEGSVSQAARLLGTSHQHLARILETRHQDLLPLRTPVKRRRKRNA